MQAGHYLGGEQTQPEQQCYVEIEKDGFHFEKHRESGKRAPSFNQMQQSPGILLKQHYLDSSVKHSRSPSEALEEVESQMKEIGSIHNRHVIK